MELNNSSIWDWLCQECGRTKPWAYAQRRDYLEDKWKNSDARKKQASSDISSEAVNVELEYVLAFGATGNWTGSCWAGAWTDDLSFTQVPGIRSGAGGSGSLRALGCGHATGQLGTPLLVRTHCWIAVGLLRATLKKSLIKRDKLHAWK